GGCRGRSAASPNEHPPAPASAQAVRAPTLAGRAGARVEPPLVLQGPKGEVRRLPLARGGEEARLPPGEAGLVLDQEPDHHLDARVLPRNRVRLRQVPRLRVPGDPEGAIRRAGLVAVLRNPDRLLAVEPGQLLRQVTEVAQDDRVLPSGLGGRRLGRSR